MRIRGLITGLASTAVVVAGAAVAVAMTHPAPSPAAMEPLPTIAAPPSSIRLHATSTRPGAPAGSAASTTPAASTSAAATTSPAASGAPAASPASPAVPAATRPTGAGSKPASNPAPTPRPPSLVGGPLPLGYPTGDAVRVITVTAASSGSTTATLQAWNRASGGWVRYGAAILAHVGAQGIGAASETRSATPAGSFTLTQAFGAASNPGSPLPYFQTNSADWWISQAGSLYNTHQHCSGSCPFTQGSPNEHLYYERPYYTYAVVIDYNTRNAPGGVRPGAGSAFFLHVTDGRPTAGCVAVAQSSLVTLMRWLAPAAHPRILIGVT